MHEAASGTRPSEPGATVGLTRALTAAALAISAVLLSQSMQGSGLPGCGRGSGCDAVLSSTWARIGPVPASAAAIGVYAVMLAALFRRRGRASDAVLGVCAGAVIGAAGWFIYLQGFVIGSWCKYCLAAHGCGATASLLAWRMARHRWAWGGAGLALAAAMATVQGVFPAPTMRLTLLEGTIGFDRRDFPIIGPADAPVVIAELYDYTCPHCRTMDAMLDAARRRYGDQLAIAAIPVPLNSRCNPFITQTQPLHEQACELATTAVAVWLSPPRLRNLRNPRNAGNAPNASDAADFSTGSSFEVMHRWLFEHQGEVTVAAAREKAAELVGEAALQEAMRDPSIGERFAAGAQLHARFDGGLPQVLTSALRIQGLPPDEAGLFRLLEEHTTLRPR